MFAAIRPSFLPRLQVLNSVRAFSVPTNSVPTISPIQYGTADFGKIRREGSWYVDNTRFLPVLESAAPQLFFVRPPRFGKSLFLSMMKHYYDINCEDRFEDLFKGLWIHDKPTDLRTSFHVLHLDLSIAVDGDIHAKFTNRVNNSISECCCKYGLSSEDVVTKGDAESSLFRLALKFRGKNFMVLIDEYDRFANALMFDAYNKIIKGKSGEAGSSLLRSFLTQMKSIPNIVAFSKFRTFITGITPLVLADASGYNVAYNISLDSCFGDMIGFHESDINEALRKYLQLDKQEQTRVLDIMRSHYDGYLPFSWF
jgi:hypothetical protein